MKKIFTLMAVALIGAAAAQAETTTTSVTVKTWLTPTEYVKYDGTIEVPDTADTDAYFTVVKGLGNVEDYPFYFKFVGDKLAIYDAWYDQDFKSEDNTVGVDINNDYYGYVYAGQYFYGNVAEDYSWGYLTFYSYSYDWTNYECTVENWAAMTSISWPAQEAPEVVEGRYTNGRTGETLPVSVNIYPNGAYLVPSFLGQAGYDLEFNEYGLWSPTDNFCYNPAEYGSDYYINLSTKMQVNWEEGEATNGEAMHVTAAVADMEAKTLTLTYAYGAFNGEYIGDEEPLYTDTLTWGEAGAVTTVEADQTDVPEELYNLQGVRVERASAPAGIYISRQGTQTRKVVVK